MGLMNVTKLRIGPKLIGGFLIVAGLVAVAAGTGIWNVGSVAEQTEVVTLDRVPQADAAMELNIREKSCRVNLLQLSLVRTNMDEWSQYKAAYQQEADEYAKWCQAILEGDEELGVRAARKGGHIEQLAGEAQAKFAACETVAEKLINHKKKLLERVKAGDITAADNLTDAQLTVLVREDLVAVCEAAETSLEAIEEHAAEQIEIALEEAETVRTSARTTLIAVLVIAVGIAVGLGLLISRSITKPVNQLRDASLKMAKGNTDIQLTITSRDELGELGQAFGQMRENIRGVVAEAAMLREAGVEGKLDTRGDAARFGGDFGKIVQGVNDTLDAVIGPLNVAAEYVDRISKGDVPEKITDEYKGDFNEVKNNLNQCIDAVNGLVAEAVMLRNAGVEGKLDTHGQRALWVNWGSAVN